MAVDISCTTDSDVTGVRDESSGCRNDRRPVGDGWLSVGLSAGLLLRNPFGEEERDHGDERQEREGSAQPIQASLLVHLQHGLGRRRIDPALQRRLELGVGDEGDAGRELHARLR